MESLGDMGTPNSGFCPHGYQEGDHHWYRCMGVTPPFMAKWEYKWSEPTDAAELPDDFWVWFYGAMTDNALYQAQSDGVVLLGPPTLTRYEFDKSVIDGAELELPTMLILTWPAYLAF